MELLTLTEEQQLRLESLILEDGRNLHLTPLNRSRHIAVVLKDYMEKNYSLSLDFYPCSFLVAEDGICKISFIDHQELDINAFVGLVFRFRQKTYQITDHLNTCLEESFYHNTGKLSYRGNIQKYEFQIKELHREDSLTFEEQYLNSKTLYLKLGRSLIEDGPYQGKMKPYFNFMNLKQDENYLKSLLSLK